MRGVSCSAGANDCGRGTGNGEAAGYPAVVLVCWNRQEIHPPQQKKNHPIPSLAVNIKRTRRGEIAANGRLNQAWGLETVKFNILLTFPLICATAPPLVEARFAFFLFFFWLGLAFRHHCV